MSLADLRRRVSTQRTRLLRSEGRLAGLSEEKAKLEVQIAKIESAQEVTREAIKLVQAATEARRAELKDRVEGLVTNGLAAVFGPGRYEFGFDVSLKGDRFGMIPLIRSPFYEKVLETEVAGGHGGGVSDVVSFILRVVLLALSRPKLAQVMVLDEFARNVSRNRLRNLAGLIKELSQSAGIQFILITHKPELLDAADVVYEAELLPEGATQFTLTYDSRDDAYQAGTPEGAGVRRERDNDLDGEDVTGAHNDAESIESETTDVLARRQRTQGRRRPDRKKKR